MGLLDLLLARALPAACLACHAAAGRPASTGLGLCPACRGRLRPLPAAAACAGCGRPLAGRLPSGWRCGACRQRPPAYDRLLCGWSYEPPCDAVIAGLKFRRLDYLGAHLAAALHARLGPELGGCDVVVPVPLHWRRRLARGFNQAEAIARPLAARLGLPCERLLRRRRATAPQSGLDRAARRRNPRGAFAAPRPPAIHGRAVLLVDDVVTTGATLDAAARCLRRAGARAIVALAAARTPEPR
jgi:ComF family protein